MKLLKLSYIDSNWELKDLELNSVNLVVAKNSTGKSRTLSTLDLLVKMITQRRDLNWGGRWSIEFCTFANQIVKYDFATSYREQGVVTAERILIDNVQYLFRDKNGSAKIKNKLTGTFDDVHPPENKLVLHTNRDIRKYPFLENIADWAEKCYGFKFGNISPFSKLNQQEYDLLTAVEDIPTLFQSLNSKNQDSVIKQFNSTGYSISKITVQNKEIVIIYVKEDGVEKPLPHYQLSQGMFRTLSVIIYLEYLISRKKPAMIIIDDLCEGLDYERAKKLGELIFNKCLQSDIQLVATSNDVFLMDVVDIKYWNILMRKGKVITALNNKNSPKIFSDFRFTGLSNFDFFASDFLKQELQ